MTTNQASHHDGADPASPRLREVVLDKRGRLDRDRYRSNGAYVSYLVSAAVLFFLVPSAAYRVSPTLLELPSAAAVVGGLLVVAAYCFFVDALLTRLFARFPAPSPGAGVGAVDG